MSSTPLTDLREPTRARASQASSSHERNSLDERRTATRMQKTPDTEFGMIWSRVGEALPAEVHDESLGGLALLVDDATGYRVGGEVEIYYQSTIYTGEVRHIEPLSDGTFRVGFECHSQD
ncbi:MAG: hypothetical protein DWQ31_08455 [Planctomycetota bacterium]|nr:MAG: hypothetical protein DWQ31_08455 [Planctomycetota bacterium]REJ86972.1 MAG: hypothetical protein DWQ35_22715 [Planctomycetota bacterium]REK24901.1 MAG: hypothetical protein DWQ42_12455 [Planctomycetota bacterium]REK48490.1 MAG: hypothetical protein DWQ46_01985 [Planctomycetota bacterium]